LLRSKYSKTDTTCVSRNTFTNFNMFFDMFLGDCSFTTRTFTLMRLLVDFNFVIYSVISGTNVVCGTSVVVFYATIIVNYDLFFRTTCSLSVTMPEIIAFISTTVRTIGTGKHLTIVINISFK
jgi:hypothetical protein